MLNLKSKVRVFLVFLTLWLIHHYSIQAQFSFVKQFGGAGTSISLNDVRYLDIDDNGLLYMGDYADNKLKVFDASGKFVRQFGKEGYGNGKFKGCNGLTLDVKKNIVRQPL